jgi:ABC-type oligopeptide transport system ATPase subunit
LDVSIQAQIINLIEELQERLGLTYLFIAHDPSVVRHISTRVALMYLGEIVELADRVSIYRDSRHRYTKVRVYKEQQNQLPYTHQNQKRKLLCTRKL